MKNQPNSIIFAIQHPKETWCRKL